MARPKKQQIETHGKLETPATQFTTLEQVWGFNELSKYGTKDFNQYEDSLKQMNRPELEAHARKIGIVVVQDTGRLINKLLHEFRYYYDSLNKPVINQNNNTTDDSEIRKILSEGK